MKCLAPISVPNKLFGKLPGELSRHLVPCGRCPACLANKANEWAFRLEQEFKRSYNAYFVTLTYDDDHMPRDDNDNPCFSKRDVQLFIKRLRKKSKLKLKYYVSSEYGDRTFRPHYHGIIFNVDSKDPQGLIFDTWRNGNVVVGACTSSSIRYTTKYCIKGSASQRGQEEPWRLQSKGLGSNYIDKQKKWHLNDKSRFYSIRPDGVKIALPRYFKEKIYDDRTKTKHRARVQELARQKEEEAKRNFYLKNREVNPQDSTPYYKSIQEKDLDQWRIYKKKLRTRKL